MSRTGVLGRLASIVLALLLTGTATATADPTTGEVAVTITDTVTGAPMQRFCALVVGQTGGRFGCTETGQVIVADLAPGEYRVEVGGDGRIPFTRQPATVLAGQTTKVHFALEPLAWISTTMLDAATRAPVAGVCLSPVSGIGGFGNFAGWCSGADGQVTARGLPAGVYQLYVVAQDGVHGDQWVGHHGGTGSRLLAKSVSAPAGATVTVPPVLLDGAGSITGTVVDAATGAPAAGVCAYSHAGTVFDEGEPGAHCTGADGRYTIATLGPYRWPVHFINFGAHTWQWSGDRATQLTARPVRVRIGQTSTADAHLGVGATLTGRVIVPPGGSLLGHVQAFNAITGEPVAAPAFLDGTGGYRLTGIAGPQFVRVQYSVGDRWHRDAAGFGAATPVRVARGAEVTGIDIEIPPG